MIKKFMVGHYYTFRGKERGTNWNTDGHMDFFLTGKPFLCSHSNGNCASFITKNKFDERI